MSEKVKKPLWEKWWVWVIAIIVLAVAANIGKDNNQAAPTNTNTSQDTTKQDTPKQIEPKQEEPKQETATPKKEEPKNSPKISKAEFDQIQNGMTYDEVRKIIGSDGQVMSEVGQKGDQFYTVMYSWEGEGLGSNANFTFQTGKLQAKAQFGLK